MAETINLNNPIVYNTKMGKQWYDFSPSGKYFPTSPAFKEEWDNTQANYVYSYNNPTNLHDTPINSLGNNNSNWIGKVAITNDYWIQSLVTSFELTEEATEITFNISTVQLVPLICYYGAYLQGLLFNSSTYNNLPNVYYGDSSSLNYWILSSSIPNTPSPASARTTNNITNYKYIICNNVTSILTEINSPQTSSAIILSPGDTLTDNQGWSEFPQSGNTKEGYSAPENLQFNSPYINNKTISLTFTPNNNNYAAGTYYLYLMGLSNDSTGNNQGAIWLNNATMSISYEPAQSKNKYVWVYANNKWNQATPWIYNGTVWKKATGVYVYNNGWKEWNNTT